MNTANRVDVTSSTIFRLLLIVLSFWFLYLIRDVLMILLAAIVISSALEPLARWLRSYHVPRALSVVVVYVLVISAIGSAAWLMVPPLKDQLTQLSRVLPQVIDSVQSRVGFIGEFSQGSITSQLQEGLKQFGDNIASFGFNVVQQTRQVFSGIVSLLFMLIIAFYLVIEEDALKKVARVVIPQKHVLYGEHIIDRIQSKLGRWVLAQLTLAVVIGIVVGIGLWILGVPYALSLGLLAGVLEVVPVIGPIIAGVFGVIVALSQSFFLAVITFAFYVVVQQVENHILIPNIMRKATGLNPLVTLLAVLLGGRLAGVAGVILSVPVATILSIAVSDIFDSKQRSSIPDENSLSTPAE